MTRDDIIRMAREADIDWHKHWDDEENRLERFAKLIYEHTWKEAGIAATKTVIDAAVLDEREQCARVCEQRGMVKGGEVFAARIRARGEK